MTTEEKVKVETITVTFKKGIQANGQISRVQIHQYGAFLNLSAEQARSLARTILAKFGDQ